MRFGYAFSTLAGLSLAALPAAAFAHGSMKPMHGGIVTMTGETVVELVRAPQGVDIYITEEDEPLAAAGFDGKVTVSTAGSKAETPLAAQAGNHMAAPGLAIPAGSKVVVALTAKDTGAKTLASFTIE